MMRLTKNLIWIGLWAAQTAYAEEMPDVRRSLGGGVVANWTELRLEVVGVAVDPTLALDTKPLEQRAITAIDARVGDDCARVPLRGEVTLADVAPRVAAEALNSWTISEGRYHENGVVEVVGVVELQPLAAGWMSKRAVPGPPLTGEGATGVVVDLRGTGIRPTYAPVIVDKQGEVLYDSVLWADVAFLRAPVVWVSDPAHPEAQRAGASPSFFVASADGARIVLAPREAQRFRTEVVPTRMIGEGAVVLVVDP